MPQSRVPSWVIKHPIAHRGLHDERLGIPENSLAAVQASIDAGFPIELDLRLLADGGVVVLHDADTFSMTGFRHLVRKSTTAEITALKLHGTSERVAMLSDVLQVVAGRVPLLLEVKCESPFTKMTAFAVANALSAYRGDYVLQSFNPFVLKHLRRLLPDIAIGQLWGNIYSDIPVHISKPDLLCYALEGIDSPRVQTVRRSGVPVVAWTIRNEADRAVAERFADNYIFEGNGRPDTAP